MSKTNEEKDLEIAKELADEIIEDIKEEVKDGRIKDLRLIQLVFDGRKTIN